MKIVLVAATIAALSLPIAASAQVAAPPPAAAVQGQHSPGERTYNRWMKRLSPIGLSAQQQQQVENVLGQYAQQHPMGSPRDPQGTHALHDQIFSILTPDQQARLQQELQQLRAEHRARRQQMEQQQGQAPPPAR
ncbi:MAG TPA: hypothetical protein VJP76_05550 [Candidatus Tumulicola sp.]|nr:hypothetical protein [Candidatus Tumulicola sp.]